MFVQDWNNIINKVDLIIELCAQQIKDTHFFARAHQTFMKIDHILGHKEKFNIIPKADIVKASFFDHSAVKLEVKLLSCVRLFVTPWTVARQAPLFVGFSKQEY